jgi:hypothetical protein
VGVVIALLMLRGERVHGRAPIHVEPAPEAG